MFSAIRQFLVVALEEPGTVLAGIALVEAMNKFEYEIIDISLSNKLNKQACIPPYLII
jgi:hypothetical protein